MSVADGDFIRRLEREGDLNWVGFDLGHKSGGATRGVAKSSRSGDFKSRAVSCCVIFRNGDMGCKEA